MTTGFGLAHYQELAEEMNTEILRLRAVNAKLLKSLEWALPRVSMTYARPADSINYREAREAIEEAGK